MRFTCLLGALLLAPTAIAQTTQPLKAAAATFPPMPRGTADMIRFVTGGAPTFSSGAPFNDLDFTLLDTDYMDGENSGGDVFMPVDPSDVYPGANKVKYVRCVLNTDLNAVYQSANADRIILGTAEIPHPFFLRGSDGIDNDYAVIQHLDFRHGYIQLRGAAEDYRLVYCTKEEGCQTTGWYLFHAANTTPDLIAFIFPCWDIEPSVSGNPPNNRNPICNNDSTLSLTNPNHFRYAKAIVQAPAMAQGIAQYGSNGKEIIGGMTTDSQGNIYLFGCTDGNLDQRQDHENEIFVAKLNPDGKQEWVTELPMREGSMLKDGTTDERFIYVCGRTLGNLPGFTNAGRWDGIMLKLNLSDGQIVASNQWGNPGIDGYGNIVQDDAGNLFVSAQGSPSGPATTDDVYLVAKHRKSDLGSVWRALNAPNATGFIASSEAWGGLTYVPGPTPGAGRLIAAGWYFSNNGANAFVSVYENLNAASPTRPHSLIINTPNARADWVLDNVVDRQGNIYVGGFTTGDLGGAHQGEGDAFIIKYSPTLTNPVVKQFGTNRSDLIRKLEIDNQGIIYAVGYTYGHYDGNNQDPTQATGDIFIQKFDLNLNFLDKKQWGTPHEDRANTSLRGNTLYLGGMTEGAMCGTNQGTFDGYVFALNTNDLRLVKPTAIVTSTAQDLPPTTSAAKVYPNPAQDLLYVGEAGNYQIINHLGVTVREGHHQAGNMPIGTLPSGAYVIKFEQKVARFIKL